MESTGSLELVKGVQWRVSQAKEEFMSYWGEVNKLNDLRKNEIEKVLSLSLTEEIRELCITNIQDHYKNEIKKIFDGEDYKKCEEKYFNILKERNEIFRKQKLKLEIFWDYRKVIEDMKKNRYIWVEKDKEMLGKKWYVIHVSFPQMWDFKGFKDDMFISYDEVTGDLDSKYEEVSYSFQDCKRIYDMFGAYLKEYWVEHVYWFRGLNSKWSYDYWVDDWYEIRSYYSFLMRYFEELLKIDDIHYSRIIDCWISDTEIYYEKLCRYCWDYNRRDWDFIIYDIHDKKRLLLHYNGK